MSESTSVTKATYNVLIAPHSASLKRIAWAFGCAKKGSDEERQLEAILRDRLRGAP